MKLTKAEIKMIKKEEEQQKFKPHNSKTQSRERRWIRENKAAHDVSVFGV